MKCKKCNQLTLFDSRGSAVLVSSMYNVYLRELLDVLMYQIVCLGGTFREGYDLMKFQSHTASMRFARWGGFDLVCRRRSTSNTFAIFLRVIEYPPDVLNDKVFRCTTGETSDASGKVMMYGLVIDGTATGILGDLPKLQRPQININAAKGTASQQFIFRHQHVRRYFVTMFKLAKKFEYHSQFAMDLLTKSIVDIVEHALFDGIADELLDDGRI